MAIKHVDPISRIEGHLGVKCNVGDGDYIVGADVHGNLWRGFENFLLGREPNDAITFTQRICGVCPVPHGQASTYAVEAALGYNSDFQTFVQASDGGKYSPTGISANRVSEGATDDTVATLTGQGVPKKAVIIRNLVLSSEFLMSSITHQYHLAAPSYIQGPNIPPWTPYFADSYYHPLFLATGHGIPATTNANQLGQSGSTLPLDAAGFSTDLWGAVIKSYVHALRIRRLTFEAGALFAGRMPMTSSFIAGGVSTLKDEDLSAKCAKFRNLTAEIGEFIVKEYVPIFLALGALYPNFDNLANANTLNGVGLVTIKDAAVAGGTPTAVNLWTVGNKDTVGDPSAANTGWGAGLGKFISWGAFPQATGYLGLTRGFWDGSFHTINDSTDIPTNLTEHIKYSRYQQAGGYELQSNKNIAYPGVVTRTVPERGDATKYSWMKAPRYAGTACEVGPLARMVLEGYVVPGSTLASTVPGYMAYTVAGGGTDTDTGLDPVMIAADVAVALVRTGLATLHTSLDGGATLTVVDYTNINTLTKTQIVAGYTFYNAAGTAIQKAHIMGVIREWVVALEGGLSTIDRLRARAIESLVLVQAMIGGITKTATGLSFPALGGWIGELDAATGDTFVSKPYPVGTSSGFGGVEAPRGALMHFCTQTAGKIDAYQCVVPTTWNGSPKDDGGNPGAIEAAIINTKYAPTTNAFTGGGGSDLTAGGGVEPLRVAQSFDPCIACAVH